MKKNGARKLRWRLAVPLTTAFALLWLGTMALLTGDMETFGDLTPSGRDLFI